MSTIHPAIIVHGGAWAIPDQLATATVDGVKRAASIGYKCLLEHKSAIDAVQAAVIELENDPNFDAGYKYIEMTYSIACKHAYTITI